MASIIRCDCLVSLCGSLLSALQRRGGHHMVNDKHCGLPEGRMLLVYCGLLLKHGGRRIDS